MNTNNRRIHPLWSAAGMTILILIALMLMAGQTADTSRTWVQGSRFTLVGDDGTPRADLSLDESGRVTMRILAQQTAQWRLRFADDQPEITVLDESKVERFRLDLAELAQMASRMTSANRSIAALSSAQRGQDRRLSTLEDQVGAVRAIPGVLERTRNLEAALRDAQRDLSMQQQDMRRLQDEVGHQKRDIERLEREVRDLRDRPR